MKTIKYFAGKVQRAADRRILRGDVDLVWAVPPEPAVTVTAYGMGVEAMREKLGNPNKVFGKSGATLKIDPVEKRSDGTLSRSTFIFNTGHPDAIGHNANDRRFWSVPTPARVRRMSERRQKKAIKRRNVSSLSDLPSGCWVDMLQITESPPCAHFAGQMALRLDADPLPNVPRRLYVTDGDPK